MDSLAPKLRLREQFRSVMRLNHYSIRTEKSYWYWIRYFIRFHGMRHPLELGTSHVNAFLSWLATDRQVAAATQNLALNAIVFLYARVLEQPLGEIGDVVRVKRPPRLPTVLTHQEAMSIIEHLGQPYRLLASLMYGAGLRVVESSRLRLKDIDFRNQTIVVRDGKGGKDRTTLLPVTLIPPLKHRIEQIEAAWRSGENVPFGIPLLLSCCVEVVIFARCKRCWGMLMCVLLRSIPMCLAKASLAFKAHWVSHSFKKRARYGVPRLGYGAYRGCLPPPGTLPPYPGRTGMRVYWLVIWKGIRLSMPQGGELQFPCLASP